MSQVNYATQVAANATVFPLNNTSLERVKGFGFLTVYGRQEATAAGELVLDVYQNDERVVDSATMARNDSMQPNKSDDIIAGPLPCIPDQYIRAVLREIAGAAMDLRVTFEFTPASMQEVAAAIH